MSEWREAQADALDLQAGAILRALDQLGVVHEILEARGRDAACTELRACCSLLRGEEAAIASEASALRISASSEVLPMVATAGAVTSYHARRRS